MTTMRFAGTEAFNSGFGTSFGTYSGGAYGLGINSYGYTGDTTSILESRYNTLQTSQSYELGQMGEDSIITSKINNFVSYLENGQEDRALEAYQELLEQMKQQTKFQQLVSENGDDAQLRAVNREFIESEIGVDLEDLIREYSRDAKGVEYQQKMFGKDKVDSVSQEDLLAEICDLKETEEPMKWYDNVKFGLDWFFNPWQRWFAGNRVD